MSFNYIFLGIYEFSRSSNDLSIMTGGNLIKLLALWGKREGKYKNEVQLETKRKQNMPPDITSSS